MATTLKDKLAVMDAICGAIDRSNEEEQADSVPRATAARHRYEIGDDECGVVATASSLKAALHEARCHGCKHVEVFDRMARFDCAQTWDAFGNILTFKHRHA